MDGNGELKPNNKCSGKLPECPTGLSSRSWSQWRHPCRTSRPSSHRSRAHRRRKSWGRRRARTLGGATGVLRRWWRGRSSGKWRWDRRWRSREVRSGPRAWSRRRWWLPRGGLRSGVCGCIEAAGSAARQMGELCCWRFPSRLSVAGRYGLSAGEEDGIRMRRRPINVKLLKSSLHPKFEFPVLTFSIQFYKSEE